MAYKLFTAKQEVTYGVEAVQAAGDAAWVRNFDFTPTGETVELDFDRPGLGAAPQKVFGQRVEFTFETLLAASGVAGTAPAWGIFAKSSGWAETIAAGASVTYSRLSDPDLATSLSGTWSDQKRRHKILGSRGRMARITMNAGEAPFISWAYKGILVPVTARANVVPADADLSDWTETDPIQQALTTFSIGGVPLQLREYSVESTDNVQFIDLTGQKGVFLRGQAALTGNVKAHQPAIGTFNPEAKWLASSKEAFALTHGMAAGNIVTVNGRCQLGQPKWERIQEFDVFGAPIRMVASDLSSNDDFSIVCT